jgi:hypothetical protein
MTSATSPFDNVPNEVLDLVIYSIPRLDDSYVTYEKDGSSRRIHQIIALMHVSRRFRFAVLTHKFWRDINFDFVKLVATISNDDYFDQLFPVKTHRAPVSLNTCLSLRITNLCNLLFCNRYFLDGIKNKTAWTFRSLEVLFTVVAYLPEFRQLAQRVILFLDGTDVAINRLHHCQNLAFLIIVALAQTSMDLDRIGRCATSLRGLHLRLPAHWAGSLKDLQGLEELSLDARMAWRDTDDAVVSLDYHALLPVASANTLTRMHLQWVDFPEDVTFKDFSSLKQLSTEGWPVDSGLADHIHDLPARLSSLASVIEVPPTANVEYNLVECACLADLTAIRLTIEQNGDTPTYNDDCMELVAEVVNRMKLLEEVQLAGGFDLEKIRILGQLQNLRRLRWIVREDQYPKGVGPQDITSQVLDLLAKMGKKMELVEIVKGPRSILGQGVF